MLHGHFGQIQYFFKVLKTDSKIQYFFNTFNTAREPWKPNAVIGKFIDKTSVLQST